MPDLTQKPSAEELARRATKKAAPKKAAKPKKDTKTRG